MILRILGRTFIAAGLLVLLFLGYQLFGTNLVTKQHQKSLAEDLRSSWEETAPSPTPSPIETTEPTVPSPGPAAPAQPRPRPKPDLGSGIAILEIPKIEVESVVVEGVTVPALKKGPGHMPFTAHAGERGNMVISGHRTTYGAPFYHLDELKPGDEIRVATASKVHLYRVTQSKVVSPDDLSVTVQTTDARLTLTTCHPRFSARQRLVVVAELENSAPRAQAA